MEQAVTLPSYMYIPAPIQQEIAKYQTGELLEVYKFGWRRDKRIAMAALLLLVISLPIGIIGVIGAGYMLVNGLFEYVFVNRIYLNYGTILLATILPLIGFSLSISGVYILFEGSMCICAYRDGLIYEKNMHVTWIPWYEFTHVKRKTTKLSIQADGSPGLGRIFTLQTYDGRRVRFRGRALVVDDLGKILREKIAH